jgi:hypothetical protein
MNLRKRIIIAGIVGLVISFAGYGLAFLGGLGPCGPASNIAWVGFWLSMVHVCLIYQVIPELGTVLSRLHVEVPFLMLWPAFIWSAVVFAALTAINKLKDDTLDKSGKWRPGN